MNILIFGAQGQLGWELQRALSPLGPITALDHAAADLEKPVTAAIAQARPAVIVNAAAYTAVDRAETEPERAWRINAEAVGEMARAAAGNGALLVHYSTDYVFDGRKAGAYLETDVPAPLSSYGRSKLAGEQAIRSEHACRHLIFRTSWVYAKRGRNFALTVLERARTLERLPVVDDTLGVPTSAAMLADVTALAVQRLALEARSDQDAVGGTFHLVPAGQTTWYGYARYLLSAAQARGLALRLSPEAIVPVPAHSLAAAAARPLNSQLDNRAVQQRFGLQLPDWRWHVQRLVEELVAA